MNLSEAFLEEAIKNNEITVVWTYIDNMYPSIKLEYNINNEDKEYIKSFLLSL